MLSDIVCNQEVTYTVSILTRPEGRMLWEEFIYVFQVESVSILTRPEGRMLSGCDREIGAIAPFQSSPGPKAGCYVDATLERPDLVEAFQSSPGPKAGCYRPSMCPSPAAEVFQSSPGPKAGCYSRSGPEMAHGLRFNPHPARRPDAILCPHQGIHIQLCFNPHPARRPDAIAIFGLSGALFIVSILTRPEGRMLFASIPSLGGLPQFQSSPGPKAGCYEQVNRFSSTAPTFQSSPGPKAGCYLLRSHRSEGCLSFNPHPARRPDAMSK